MCESAFINFDTQMSAEIYYVQAPFRSNSDHRYTVILRDLDSDSVVATMFFHSLENATAKAEKLVFPSSGVVNSPAFLPAIR